MAASAAVPAPAPRALYFLHIPKTAGTSIIEALDQRYAPEVVCPEQLIDPLLAAPADVLRRASLFRGHLGARLEEVVERPLVTFTMVRDPVARTRSHFRHVRREPEHPLHEHVNAPGFDLLAFAEDPATQPLVRNFQARHLTRSIAQAPRSVPAFARHPLARQMAFEVAPLPADDDDGLQAALAALRGVDVVGTVEEGPDAALARLAAVMGWREPLRARRLRVAPADDTLMCPDAVAAIRRLTQVDAALHAAASGHRMRRPEHGTWWWRPQRRCPRGSGWDDLGWSDVVGWHRWTLGPEAVAGLDGPASAVGGSRLVVRVDVGAAEAAELLAGLVVDLDGTELPYTRLPLPSGGQRLTAHAVTGARAPRTVRLRLPGGGTRGRGVVVTSVSVAPESSRAQ